MRSQPPVRRSGDAFKAYLSFAVLAAALEGQLVQHGQQVEGLLWLEGEQVQVHQQETHGLGELLC